MPKSSNYLWGCSYPINFDTYEGCEHRCSYCYAQWRNPGKKGMFKKVTRGETVASLRNWIEGKRGAREKWADWRIPICWGRSSDPFQPMEREKKWSLECLQLLAETKYPFIVTTKSTLIAEEPYKSLFAKCNCLVQISMVCSEYNQLERGAPPYEARLACAATMSKLVPRVIARWQPLFLEKRPTFDTRKCFGEIPRLKAAGVYGVLCEMIESKRPLRPWLTDRRGNCYGYYVNMIESAYKLIRKRCHENGLVFLTGDQPRLSDSLECCGTEGLGWEPNLCTTVRHFLSPETYAERPCQCKPGTGCAWKNVYTRALAEDTFSKGSFAEHQRTLWDKKHEYVVMTGLRYNGAVKSSANRKGGDTDDQA